MSAVFTFGGQQEEILDLTAPATQRDGIVARWSREALARGAGEPSDAPPEESGSSVGP